MTHPAFRFLALALGLALAACGGSDGASGGGHGRCARLELGDGRLFFNAYYELTGIRYPVRATLGDPNLPDYVLIELYDSTTETAGAGFLPPLEPGAFDLTTAPDDRLATCQHCVSLVVDVTEGPDSSGFPVFQAARWFSARSGQLHLEQVQDPLNAAPENSAMVGSASNVEVDEVDASDADTPFLEGGECFLVPALSFDTRPTPGEACQDIGDCGNELLEVCDPTTLACVDDIQCGLDLPCASQSFCIQQSPVSPWGACYPVCTPFASGSCPQGQTCVQYGLSEHDGYCLTAGDAAVGATCESKTAVTSCTGDAVCQGTCTAQCGFFSGDPSCPSTSACDVLGHCRPPTDGDPAKLGETCGTGAELASPCARNGARFDGICFGYDATLPFVCGKSCFVDADDYDGNADDGASDLDCSPDSFCALRFTSGLGICRPDPVCGDAEPGEVGEACDDGNLLSGDGCSADCQTVEYGPLCAAATPLPIGTTVEGTTVGGVDGFMGSCQFGAARGRVYTVVPPGPGQLRLSLVSPSDTVVSVRSDCATLDSELGCGYSSPTDAALVLELPDAEPGPLTVLVNASTVLEEGPFSLTAAFTLQVCGDGNKVGGEACDDGNAVGGDGCSADCLALEYPYWCATADVLPLDVTVNGQLGGGYSLFSPSCGFGDAPDTLYTITAPRDGTLTVSLDQSAGDLDLALFALDGCGVPSGVTELACSSDYFPNEELTLSVKQGQTVWLDVDGLDNRSGQYAISARLQ